MLDLLFGSRTLVFESPLSLDEVTRRLARDVAPATWRLNDDRAQPFKGTVADGRFRMVRLVRGRNAFRPVIEGQLSPGSRGARIDVRMKASPAVVILGLILCAAGGGLAALAADEIGATRLAGAWFGLALALAACVFMPGVEARRATRLMASLFESAPSRPVASRPG